MFFSFKWEHWQAGDNLVDPFLHTAGILWPPYLEPLYAHHWYPVTSVGCDPFCTVLVSSEPPYPMTHFLHTAGALLQNNQWNYTVLHIYRSTWWENYQACKQKRKMRSTENLLLILQQYMAHTPAGWYQNLQKLLYSDTAISLCNIVL